MQKPSLLNIVKLIAGLIFSMAIIASLLACFSLENSTCELLCHFKFHYLILSFILLILMILNKKPLLIVGALAWFIFNAVPVMPYYVPWRGTASNGHHQIKLMQSNLLLTNQSYDKVIALVQQEKPDIIGFEEFTFQWAARLKPIEKEYPYRMLEPRDGSFGVALYSKSPLSNTHTENFGFTAENERANMPSIVTTITLERQSISLIVTHPVPPAFSNLRNSQLEDMGQARSRFNKNLIIMGDLNSSQWSPYFQRLLQQTGLRDSQLGFGVQASWQSTDWLLRIPIDHILISPSINVLNRHFGASIDSDHLPVFTEIALK